MRAGRSWTDVAVGMLASAGAVALVTAAIDVLEPHVPVLSLGVLYVFAVLPVALLWGVVLGAAVSVASMLAFNWFFLPPQHTFHLHDAENWAVLAVYLVTAFVVSARAARARRRAGLAERREREAAALAAIAGDLLAGTSLPQELERVARLTARVLGVSHARIVLGDAEPADDERAHLLAAGDRRVGTLLVSGEHEVEREGAVRFLPALASLLAVELDRSALEAGALEAEALRRSDAIKTAVLHAVSHDLRSPLTAIVAAASGLANPEVRLARAERDELVETIRVEADRLDRVVSNLLDLSRLRSGVVLPHLEVWPVEALVGRALEALGPTADRVVVELEPDAPPVAVDALQIERVLVNLIDNALKFSPAGSPVHVRSEADGEELRLHVLDLGPGVPEPERELVFEAFRRGAEPGRSGAGLGLAIARGFAEANRARVWSEEDAGNGHFVLALPAAERAPALA